MTLSADHVIKALNRDFVCGWKNIKGSEKYAGKSNTHMPEYSAIRVGNSAGHHNVQMFFMTSDGKVLHCLPGFWSPRHLRLEMKLARDLAKVYFNKKISPAKRNEIFLAAHLEHALEHDSHTRNSSKLQGFDKSNVAKRKESDFKREKGFIKGNGVIKTADQVSHERMATYPFVSFENFDVAKYIDMGLKKYKYNHGVPGKECEMKKAKRSQKQPKKKYRKGTTKAREKKSHTYIGKTK